MLLFAIRANPYLLVRVSVYILDQAGYDRGTEDGNPMITLLPSCAAN